MNNFRKKIYNIFLFILSNEIYFKGCEPAIYFSALGNEDPGVLTVALRLFTLPEDALKSTFRLPKSKIDAINKTLPVSLFYSN